MFDDEIFVGKKAMCVEKAGDQLVDACCKCGQEKGGCKCNPL
jgi:hypothetical protein